MEKNQARMTTKISFSFFQFSTIIRVLMSKADKLDDDWKFITNKPEIRK